ncbi:MULTISPECIES: hypothetical protein [Burkholderia]|uniref:Secreted protein n=1 Tax=Burkholderia anthina TaxID=179879 RepID=A0ABS2BDG5_9BURK|nr:MULTISPECIES: hypothetical protein [Burkholderia]MBM2771047.1 hypothetical protein [Burkholderia anthina]QTD91971.1 hypothetical protein J4G50_27380 [Burkholderia anthina]
MLHRSNVIVCARLFFSAETHSRSRRGSRYPLHGASQQPASIVRQKPQGPAFTGSSVTAGTTVIYEDRVSP